MIVIDIDRFVFSFSWGAFVGSRQTETFCRSLGVEASKVFPFEAADDE